MDGYDEDDRTTRNVTESRFRFLPVEWRLERVVLPIKLQLCKEVVVNYCTVQNTTSSKSHYRVKIDWSQSNLAISTLCKKNSISRKSFILYSYRTDNFTKQTLYKKRTSWNPKRGERVRIPKSRVSLITELWTAIKVTKSPFSIAKLKNVKFL